MTLFVNLFGGPGIGKSTMAAGLFSGLKREGISCEYVTEYAKELVWDGRIKALDNQISVLGEQWRRLELLDGKVDVVINDSPVLFCSIYAPKEYPESFHSLCVWCQKHFPSVNIRLRRVRNAYETSGRKHDNSEALLADDKILSTLKKHNIFHIDINADSDGEKEALKTILEKTGS